jgi:hypothetical protein
MWLKNEYSDLKLAEATMGRGTGIAKRSGRDESVWVAIHKCMETTQGISLYSYLYLKPAKLPCFSYYLLYFSLLQNQRTGGRNRFCTQGWGG